MNIARKTNLKTIIPHYNQNRILIQLLRIMLFILLFFFFFKLAEGQTFRVNYKGFGEGWKLTLKSGTGLMLSEIPEKYLENLNNVNIPQGQFGLTAVASLKKMAIPHLYVGYQLDYMRIRGQGKSSSLVTDSNSSIEVLTQGLGHNFTMGYYLKKKKREARTNYFIQYKIGALSLTNKPLEDGISQVKPDFLSNVAVITGWGVGITYQFKKKLSFVFEAEINRTSDVISDLHKFYKVVYDSPNTVNHYLILSTGIKLNLDFEIKKKNVTSHLPFSGN